MSMTADELEALDLAAERRGAGGTFDHGMEYVWAYEALSRALARQHAALCRVLGAAREVNDAPVPLGSVLKRKALRLAIAAYDEAVRQPVSQLRRWCPDAETHQGADDPTCGWDHGARPSHLLRLRRMLVCSACEQGYFSRERFWDHECYSSY